MTTTDSPRFNFQKANFIELYKLFQSKNWNELYSIKNSNSAAKLFQNLLIDILKETVPLKNTTGRRRYPTWFTREIIQKLARKFSLHKALKKWPNDLQ